MKLSSIKPNPQNPRNISPENIDKLAKSIKSFERMMSLRPIVIDKDNIIIGGNQRYAALKKAGYKEIPDEWVVKADDLTDEQRREFIVKDNVNLGLFDFDALSVDYELDELDEWGLELPAYITDKPLYQTEDVNEYTTKIDVPTYEPKNEKPDIKELVSIDKTKELIKEIESSEAPKEIKDFLKNAAQRHLVFNYAKIADFYAHSDEKIQKLFEKSALVIIDINDAISNGYVKLSKEMSELYSQDYPDE